MTSSQPSQRTYPNLLNDQDEYLNVLSLLRDDCFDKLQNEENTPFFKHQKSLQPPTINNNNVQQSDIIPTSLDADIIDLIWLQLISETINDNLSTYNRQIKHGIFDIPNLNQSNLDNYEPKKQFSNTSFGKNDTNFTKSGQSFNKNNKNIINEIMLFDLDPLAFNNILPSFSHYSPFSIDLIQHLQQLQQAALANSTNANNNNNNNVNTPNTGSGSYKQFIPTPTSNLNTNPFNTSVNNQDDTGNEQQEEQLQQYFIIPSYQQYTNSIKKHNENLPFTCRITPTVYNKVSQQFPTILTYELYTTFAQQYNNTIELSELMITIKQILIFNNSVNFLSQFLDNRSRLPITKIPTVLYHLITTSLHSAGRDARVWFDMDEDVQNAYLMACAVRLCPKITKYLSNSSLSSQFSPKSIKSLVNNQSKHDSGIDDLRMEAMHQRLIGFLKNRKDKIDSLIQNDEKNNNCQDFNQNDGNNNNQSPNNKNLENTTNNSKKTIFFPNDTTNNTKKHSLMFKKRPTQDEASFDEITQTLTNTNNITLNHPQSLIFHTVTMLENMDVDWDYDPIEYIKQKQKMNKNTNNNSHHIKNDQNSPTNTINQNTKNNTMIPPTPSILTKTNSSVYNNNNNKNTQNDDNNDNKYSKLINFPNQMPKSNKYQYFFKMMNQTLTINLFNQLITKFYYNNIIRSDINLAKVYLSLLIQTYSIEYDKFYKNPQNFIHLLKSSPKPIKNPQLFFQQLQIDNDYTLWNGYRLLPGLRHGYLKLSTQNSVGYTITQDKLKQLTPVQTKQYLSQLTQLEHTIDLTHILQPDIIQHCNEYQFKCKLDSLGDEATQDDYNIPLVLTHKKHIPSITLDDIMNNTSWQQLLQSFNEKTLLSDLITTSEENISPFSIHFILHLYEQFNLDPNTKRYGGMTKDTFTQWVRQPGFVAPLSPLMIELLFQRYGKNVNIWKNSTNMKLFKNDKNNNKTIGSNTAFNDNVKNSTNNSTTTTTTTSNNNNIGTIQILPWHEFIRLVHVIDHPYEDNSILYWFNILDSDQTGVIRPEQLLMYCQNTIHLLSPPCKHMDHFYKLHPFYRHHGYGFVPNIHQNNHNNMNNIGQNFNNYSSSSSSNSSFTNHTSRSALSNNSSTGTGGGSGGLSNHYGGSNSSMGKTPGSNLSSHSMNNKNKALVPPTPILNHNIRNHKGANTCTLVPKNKKNNNNVENNDIDASSVDFWFDNPNRKLTPLESILQHLDKNKKDESLVMKDDTYYFPTTHEFNSVVLSQYSSYLDPNHPNRFNQFGDKDLLVNRKSDREKAFGIGSKGNTPRQSSSYHSNSFSSSSLLLSSSFSPMNKVSSSNNNSPNINNNNHWPSPALSINSALSQSSFDTSIIGSINDTPKTNRDNSDMNQNNNNDEITQEPPLASPLDVTNTVVSKVPSTYHCEECYTYSTLILSLYTTIIAQLSDRYSCSSPHGNNNDYYNNTYNRENNNQAVIIALKHYYTNKGQNDCGNKGKGVDKNNITNININNTRLIHPSGPLTHLFNTSQYDITSMPVLDYLDNPAYHYGINNNHSGLTKYNFLYNPTIIRIIQALCYPPTMNSVSIMNVINGSTSGNNNAQQLQQPIMQLIEAIVDDNVEFLPRNLYGYLIKTESNNNQSKQTIPLSRWGGLVRKVTDNDNNSNVDGSQSTIIDEVKLGLRRGDGNIVNKTTPTMTDDPYPINHMNDDDDNINNRGGVENNDDDDDDNSTYKKQYPTDMFIRQYSMMKQVNEVEDLSVREVSFVSFAKSDAIAKENDVD